MKENEIEHEKVYKTMNESDTGYKSMERKNPIAIRARP